VVYYVSCRFPPYACSILLCINAIYATKNCNLTEPVLQHLIVTYCTMQMLIIGRRQLSLACVMPLTLPCARVIKLSLDLLQTFTGQMDIAQEILRHRKRFVHNCMQCCNAVVKFCTSCYRLFFFLSAIICHLLSVVYRLFGE